jgi:ribonuclease HI
MSFRLRPLYPEKSASDTRGAGGSGVVLYTKENGNRGFQTEENTRLETEENTRLEYST